MDPTKEQWKEIAELCQSKGHIPFFDVAYQGFATGSLDQDAWAPRYFVEQGLEVFVSQSYSKNLGLYAERVGAINAVCEDKDSATRFAPTRRAERVLLYPFGSVEGARNLYCMTWTFWSVGDYELW